jgi:hypothetical protein
MVSPKVMIAKLTGAQPDLALLQRCRYHDFLLSRRTVYYAGVSFAALDAVLPIARTCA